MEKKKMQADSMNQGTNFPSCFKSEIIKRTLRKWRKTPTQFQFLKTKEVKKLQWKLNCKEPVYYQNI